MRKIAVVILTLFTTIYSVHSNAVANCIVQTSIPDYECGALEDLYYSTNGDDIWNYTDWMGPDDPCEWYGVACNSSGHIFILELAWLGLDGPLPHL